MLSLASPARSRTMSATPERDVHSAEYLDLLKKYNPPVDPEDGELAVVAAAGERSDKLLSILEESRRLNWNDRCKLVLNPVEIDGLRRTWTTPLLQAIRMNSPNNVSLLLEYGANPNGISMAEQEQYCRQFRRIKRAGLDTAGITTYLGPDDVGDAASQIFPLMEHEISSRKETISRFWLLSDTLPLDLFSEGYRSHSLVAAAHTGSNSTDAYMFNELLEAGADASFWKGMNQELHEAYLTPSALCCTTPLHAAIHNVDMMKAVLYSGLNPNSRALITGCQALTPIQEAIRAQEDESFHLLAQHPLILKNIKTPVLFVHLLHFAVARLSPELLEDVHMDSLHNEMTGLQHNPAHVACMPLDINQVQLFSPKVLRSIHDVRSLETNWHRSPVYEVAKKAEVFTKAPFPTCDGPGDRKVAVGIKPYLGLPLQNRQRGYADPSILSYGQPDTTYFARQTTVVKHIVSNCGFTVMRQKDYCGNTPLHYLASMRSVNEELISWLRGIEDDSVWTSVRNEWHYTPADLYLDNVTTTEPDQDLTRCDTHAALNVPNSYCSGRGRGCVRGRGTCRARGCGRGRGRSFM